MAAERNLAFEHQKEHGSNVYLVAPSHPVPELFSLFSGRVSVLPTIAGHFSPGT